MLRPTRLTLFVIAVGLTAGAVSLGACSDERPDAATVGNNPPLSNVGGTGDGGTTGAGQEGGAGGDRCNPDAFASLTSEGVSEITIRADTPPDPLGGELVLGTYVLQELARFAPGGGSRDDEDGGGGGNTSPATTVASKVLVIEANAYRLAERTGTVAAGLTGDAVLSGGTFTIAGTSVTLTESCPTTAKRTFGFSAVGGSISLYPAPDRRETYVKM
jgi:hypothetical protein